MRRLNSEKRQMLYPWRNEKVVGGGLDFGAMLAFLLFCVVVGWQIWVMWIPISDFLGISDRGAARLEAQEERLAELQAEAQGLTVVVTPTQGPTEVPYVLLVTPTPLITYEMLQATAGAELAISEADDAWADPLPEGYTKIMVVGRFSNYWPPSGGINAQGDAELFADGSRVDKAIVERERVVACPVELLLGTRIEYPPNSGMVWTCRDRGGAITFYYAESGLPIYWFDFMSEIPFVDYGSYIQVQIYFPCSQVEC
jgi:hypothetical protein